MLKRIELSVAHVKWGRDLIMVGGRRLLTELELVFDANLPVKSTLHLILLEFESFLLEDAPGDAALR